MMVLLWLMGSALAGVLSSDRVAVGLAADGSLIADDLEVGLLWDADGPEGEVPVGGDWLVYGIPFELWRLDWTVDGVAQERINAAPAEDYPSDLIVNQVDYFENETLVGWTGEVEIEGGAVELEIDLPWGQDLVWLTVRVVADQDLSEVVVMRAVDPDPDFAGAGLHGTRNSALDAVATAEGLEGAMALVAVDGWAGLGSWPTAPEELVAGDGSSSTGDSQLGGVVSLGDLAAGSEAEAVFLYAFGADAVAAAAVGEAAAAADDRDADGWADVYDCDPRDPTAYPEAPELPDGLDNDCDYLTDEGTGLVDDDGDGFSEADGDCDDANPEAYPNTEADPNGDDDCDGVGQVWEPEYVMHDSAGCSCGSSGGGGLAWVLGAALVALRRRRGALLGLALVGCGASGTPPALTLSVTGGAVLDARLDEAPTTDLALGLVGGDEDCALWIEARACDATEVFQESWDHFGADGATTVSWDGLDADGAHVALGPVSWEATAQCGTGSAEALASTWMLRLGPTAVDFQDGVTLAFHKTDLHTRLVQAIGEDTPEYLDDRALEGELADLDLDDGAPRPPVPVWTDPDAPPWGAEAPGEIGLGQHNVPAAYVAGSSATIVVTAGALSVGAAGRAAEPAFGPEALADPAPAVRLALDGWDGEALDWVPGATTTVSSPDWVPVTLGRDDLDLVWRWQAQVDGAWVDVPGSWTTTHRIYTLLDTPKVPDGSAIGASPAIPWIGVLDDVSGAVQGLEPDPFSAMDALRDHLNLDPYIVYDPSDSDYSDYNGSYMYWDYIWTEMSDWLDRSEGVHLYCHSVACLLTAQADTLGIDAKYMTIGVGFATNYVRAAGTEDWGTWYFNSHSFVTADDGAHVWDAAVDLDGDGDPTTAPNEALAPKGLTFDDYMGLFSPNDPSQVNGGYCYLY